MRDPQSPKDVLKPSWYLNRKQIIKLTGMSRSTLDRLERDGKFPKRVTLSTQRIGWVVREVVDWDHDRRGMRESPRLTVSAAVAKDGSISNLSTESERA